ncbi:MAG: HAMP domain-containing histidine kinase [Clostridia bacterium]|nr:HAMP domain-containing histidine kinase [Clostridia bacterium]
MGNRKIKKGTKLFRKYLTVITSVILMSVVLLCTVYLFLATRHWNSEQIDTLQHNSTIIAQNAQELLVRFNKPNSDENTDISPLSMICNTMRIMSEAIDADIFITDMNGDVVVCKEMIDDKFSFAGDYRCMLHDRYHIDPEIIEQAQQGNYTDVSKLGGTFINNQLTAASPIKVNGNSVAIVFATEPITMSWYSYAKRILEVFLTAALLALIVSFLVVYYLSYRFTRPLREMSTAVRHYAEGDFSYKVRVKGNDEIAELAQAFNSMAMSLSSQESSRRSFVANVSHELKTPMTSIGGFIDGILDGTISEDRHDYYLHIVSDEVKRLSRLVTGMLNMSKIEAGEMQINLKTFDISADIFKTLLSFEKKINDKGIEIVGLDTMQSISVNADEDMIMQVIYNLIDNAVKFTPSGGYIFIKDYKDSEKTFVSIRNSGDGIERDELAKVFERFYKIDRSRSYDVKGAGLGLFLCKSIVELHGGEIRVDSKVGEYTEFAFWIPNNI